MDFDGNIFISDFSIHSIGLILFRQKKPHIFESFISDFAINGSIISIPFVSYLQVPRIAHKYQLDFDDAYQTAVATEHNLGIMTMDADFRRVAKDLSIRFL